VGIEVTENKEKIVAISERMVNLKREATSEVIQEVRANSIKEEQTKALEGKEPIAIPKVVGKTAEMGKELTRNDVLILLIIYNFSIIRTQLACSCQHWDLPFLHSY
jgi:hypothetical protein